MSPHDAPPPSRSPSFDAAIAAFDKANSHDPHTIERSGAQIPYELFYAREVTSWALQLDPAASEPLLLAARCQHLCRWEIPRQSYEMTRAGYLKWRADLKRFHAEKAGQILTDAGCTPETIARVRALNLKEGLGRDPEMQILEDALCLVTLQHQLHDLMEKTDRPKLLEILRKTWRKMSPAGHQAALQIPYTESQMALLQEALSPA